MGPFEGRELPRLKRIADGQGVGVEESFSIEGDPTHEIVGGCKREPFPCHVKGEVLCMGIGIADEHLKERPAQQCKALCDGSRAAREERKEHRQRCPVA